MKLTNWDYRFLSLAEHISKWSKDPSTKCGAVITKGNKIISLGFNGFPHGMKDNKRLNKREIKYQLILHAETNAILFSNQSLVGCSMYVWPLPPCCRCAVNIIQCGITKVVAPTPSKKLGDRWKEELDLTNEIFQEVKMNFITVPF